MSFRRINMQSISGFRLRFGRLLSGVFLLLFLAACSSQAADEAELAALDAARVAADQEAARVAQDQARMLAAEEQRLREAQAAERAKADAERQRQAQVAEARAEEQRQRRAQERQREQARMAAIAAAEAQRQEKLDRIAQLEQQIASVQASGGGDAVAQEALSEAIAVAEELLLVLTAEQDKYANTDAEGNTLEPLAKDLIADLEQRKDLLVRQANSQ